ncbi:sensor histidine kinase [Microlunatus parietis]|uniref:histidine kinase n=1 Tax=Microlunatus parietis TaxID=682979 RepID=A0A7Y9LE57_9ACTN|nr:sensor histidine kinase [Microlunatus parietis]NYE72706.1 signal transduction histidine kinase [Microlunatus parietis]
MTNIGSELEFSQGAELGATPQNGPDMSDLTQPSPIDSGNALARTIRQAGRDLGCVAGGFFIALFGFIVCVPLFSLGVGTAVTVFGLFVLTAALVVAGGFAQFHRNLLAGAGYELRRPVYPRGRMRFWGRMRRLRSAQGWRDLLHIPIAFVVNTASFCIAIPWVVAGPGGLTYWFWSQYLPDEDRTGLAWLLGFPGVVADVILTTMLGAFFLITAPFVLRGLVMLQAAIAKGLLVDEASHLRQQVSELTHSRAAAGEAEAHTLRRLERDLHDGPQQRLVRLGMDLGAVERRLDTDPDTAKQILRQAMEQSQEALAEIRTLSRGIAPPILTERGLRAAVTALAARGVIPTTVDIDEDLDQARSLSDAAQNAVYFVVAETLANKEKYSQASTCAVEVRRLGGVVVITITDDGVGGASVAKGHGLVGLTDRLAGVDGNLHVSSPVGGPTMITATVPVNAMPQAAPGMR